MKAFALLSLVALLGSEARAQPEIETGGLHLALGKRARKDYGAGLGKALDGMRGKDSLRRFGTVYNPHRLGHGTSPQHPLAHHRLDAKWTGM